MGEITIRMQSNLETGKKDVWIDLVSEPDSLPIEHEQDHRQIVEGLLGKGILKEDEVGQVQVRRIAPERERRATEEDAGEGEKIAQDGGFTHDA